jgi:thiamine-monophosphate kinase
VAVQRLGEFERIARFLAPLAAPGALGLRDDVALIDGPDKQQYVLTADAIVEGVHFLGDDPPPQVAQKLLRVNLSDLAAKGATPLGYLLTTILPQSCDETWLAGFAAGLAQDQGEFAVTLLGGDSSATPGPATLSLTALGTVAAGQAILRRGAQQGDLVYVSGTIGDSALGLRALRGTLAGLSAGEHAFLAARYHLPQPRVALGRQLVGIAHAMLDVSDGLIGDLNHLCVASGVAAVLEAARVPLSPAARAALAHDETLLSFVLGGGDDYELVFAAPPGAEKALAALAASLALPITRIGHIAAGSGVQVVDEAYRAWCIGVPAFLARRFLASGARRGWSSPWPRCSCWRVPPSPPSMARRSRRRARRASPSSRARPSSSWRRSCCPSSTARTR